GSERRRVLDRVLQEEEHARGRSDIALVHQYRAALQQVAVALQREVEHGVEELMPGADESRERLARRGDELLLEGDALVPGKHRIAGADLAVAIAHRRGHVRQLVAAWFTL